MDMQLHNSVSIHIRRGDYESDPEAKIILGGICDLNFYIKSISYINENVATPFFYIFSNDPLWVKEHFSFLNNSLYVDGNIKENSWQDMMLMSNCKHNIILCLQK